ncbi:MAG TPA: RnfH family protein [Pseudomonadales bacterium]|nr:RnfH family protein [Pseudomonadales bacterium]
MAVTIPVEVAIAFPDEQIVIALDVDAGCTAREAVQRSGLTARLPTATVQTATLGVFGKVLDDPDSYVVSGGDRIEIYRPLLIDPKEARRQRAIKSRRATSD